jgi:hypothetical protein
MGFWGGADGMVEGVTMEPFVCLQLMDIPFLVL